MVYKNIIYVLLLAVLSSCVDETLVERNADGAFISIKGMGVQSATHAGSSEDYVIRTLRVLTFDPSTGNCITNIRYKASQNDIIRHPVTVGSYDFVFLANEPVTDTSIEGRLSAISRYDDLNNIAFPESYFTSERIIPMIQNRMICGRKPMKQIPMCLNWIMAGLWLASPFRKLWIPSCQ